jgi:hypothetical protein
MAPRRAPARSIMTTTTQPWRLQGKAMLSVADGRVVYRA